MNANGLCQLYVGELNPNVTEEILFNAFSKYGKIESMKVMRHIVTGASRGFAFINYTAPFQADKAKKMMNGQRFFGNILRVYLKVEFDALDQNANVIFQNLPESTTEEQVLKLISPLAKPFSVKIVKNEKKPDEVKAFLQFETMEQSQKVIEKLNGSDYEGKPLVVELTNRKNKVFIKAKHHENALEELKSNLKDWTFEEIETPEVSADNNHSLVLVKFANETMAIAFLEDFALNPAKCTLIRSNYHQSS